MNRKSFQPVMLTSDFEPPYSATQMPVEPRDLAQTMVRRKAEERRFYAERATALRSAAQSELTHARAEGLIERAWLIGSLAWGELGPHSDVDIVVSGLGVDAIGALWARLSHALGESVDLLRLETLPEDFRQRVLDQGVVLT